MPRIRPDQLVEALRGEGATALPVSRLCAALAAAQGPLDSAVPEEEVSRSARSRPDLFLLLEPTDAWPAAEWAEPERAQYSRALREAPNAPEPCVVLLADAENESDPPVHTALLALWGESREDGPGEVELLQAMRDAVELGRLLGAHTG